MRNKKVGLALGSGAFKGLSHIGVMKALLQNDVPIDMIAGSSIGSMVGGAYCAGQSPEALEAMVLSINERDYYDPTISRSGIMKGEKAREFIRMLTANKNIEDMNIPFAAVACDVNTGTEVVFREGPACEAIRGSMSVPGVFLPYVYGDYKLIDGGTVDRVPARVLREMGADMVIAVDVGFRGGAIEGEGVMDILLYAVDVAIWRHTHEVMRDADISIVPDVSGVSGSTLKTAALAIARGEQAAMEQMPAILEKLKQM